MRWWHYCLGFAAILGSGYWATHLLDDEYVCRVEGDRLRYADGVKITERTRQDGALGFELAIPPYLDRFHLDARGGFPEFLNPGIRYDRRRSDPVTAYFVYDQTDPGTGFRTVSSLVLNKTSGDVNLFHHRWIPPNGWESSDLYEFKGHCKRK